MSRWAAGPRGSWSPRSRSGRCSSPTCSSGRSRTPPAGPRPPAPSWPCARSSWSPSGWRGPDPNAGFLTTRESRRRNSPELASPVLHEWSVSGSWLTGLPAEGALGLDPTVGVAGLLATVEVVLALAALLGLQRFPELALHVVLALVGGAGLVFGVGAHAAILSPGTRRDHRSGRWRLSCCRPGQPGGFSRAR